MKFFLLTLFVLITTGLLTSCGNPSLQKSTTIQEAKIAVDYYISAWDDEYKNLCNKPRNDNLKLEFQELHDALTFITACGEKCNKLSYPEQEEVSKYAMKEFGKKKQLKMLYETNEIECW